MSKYRDPQAAPDKTSLDGRPRTPGGVLLAPRHRNEHWVAMASGVKVTGPGPDHITPWKHLVGKGMTETACGANSSNPAQWTTKTRKRPECPACQDAVRA